MNALFAKFITGVQNMTQLETMNATLSSIGWLQDKDFKLDNFAFAIHSSNPSFK